MQWVKTKKKKITFLNSNLIFPDFQFFLQEIFALECKAAPIIYNRYFYSSQALNTEAAKITDGKRR